MSTDDNEIKMEIAGLGVVFYSPKSVEHIPEGSDYLQTNYFTEEQVQFHIQKGTLVGFGTGSPGTYFLKFASGYPANDEILASEFKLRLGLHCVGGQVCFRDLYDLLDWTSQCPEAQILELEGGIYHVTLCSNRPPSGVIGDNQVIRVFLQKLDTFPALATRGVPTLCY